MDTRRSPTVRCRTRTAAWIALWSLAATVSAGCGPAPTEVAAPDIVLISLDTLRRDAVGTFNPAGGSVTPNLDALVSQTVVFQDAWAQVPFTLPSHMSIFTGLYPDVHGVERKKSRLAEGIPTLSTLLHDAGYNTLGVVSNLWMTGEFGFARGFDHYERLPYGLVYADRVNRRAFELIDARSADHRPLFLFVHYIDPHSDFFNVDQNALPYYAPPEYLRPTGISADSREFCDDQDNCATEFLLAADRERRPMTPETVARIAMLYQRGVAHLDHQFGALIDGLQSRGLWEDALVVITSDHGEEFRDHGLFIHIQPYAENLAIPLMVKLPRGRGAGSRLDATVETVDLLPTLLDAADVAHPAHLQGESLLPVIEGERPRSETAFGRDKLNRNRFALRAGEHTLIHHIDTGHSELYNRRKDPGEEQDIADDHPEEVASMRALLLDMVASNRELAQAVAAAREGSAVLNPDEVEKLRAIGYLE